MSLMEILTSKDVKQKADSRVHQFEPTIESKERTPMLTHHQSSVVRLVVWLSLAVAVAFAIQVWF